MADNQTATVQDHDQNATVSQNQQQNVSLNQNPPLIAQDNAPIPEWLQKAQLLAQHEEQAPKNQITTVPLPITGTQPVESAQQIVESPLPPWLQKAAEQSTETPPITPPPQNPAPQNSIADVKLQSEAQNPVQAESNASNPLVQISTPTIEVPIVQDQPSSPKEATPSPAGNTPAIPTPVAAPAIPVSAPTTSPEVSPSITNGATPSSTAPISSKQEIFELAKNSFLSAIDKGQSVIKAHQNAGAPKIPNSLEESVSVQQKVTSPVVAPTELNSRPESSIKNLVQESPDKASSKLSEKTTPTSKDNKKATAEEQKQLIEAEKVYQKGIATIRDLIAPSSMEIRYDSIRVEGMYAQSFFVYAYPRYLDSNWLSPIVNFDVTMDISQFIYPIESAAIMRILKKKVAQMQASVRMNASKGMVSDPALETALQDAEELRTQIQRGQEKLFQFALYFTIYSEDEKKIQKVSKQLESILGAKLILTKKAELQSEHGFNSSLPLCLDELEVVRNMNTSPLSSTFPFSSSDLTSNEGILYGLNRHNDSLIIFDRFSLENANSVVFAKSGAGKSYCVKLEILRSMMLGTDVIVIDPENEYKDLAQTVGGSYLRVSLTSDRRINPFDLPSAIEDEEVQPGDLLRSNIINLHGLLKIMLGGVTAEEEGILDKALIDVYALKGITMDLIDPSKIPPPTMEDLYDILSTMEGATSLAQRLQKYTTGTYSGIFNKPTNIDMSSGLMVFSIRDLEDALRPTAMYIILNYIWNRVRSQLKKRLLIIDEAWTMMQYEDSAKFMFGLVKRARKYYLGITTITQDVEDFMKSPYGKPVVTNSSMQVLLKQAPAAIDILSKTFNLTEGEKYMLLNSGVGQGLFFAGLKHVAIQIIASYTEDKIITTNPEEVLQNKETISN